MSDVVAVLTYKSKASILETGGTQSWVLDRARASRCDYVVICRNAHTRDPEGPEAHGSAFMVGKVKDIVPSTDTPGRWLIQISEYADVDFPDEWAGRNPVGYWKDSSFPRIDFKNLPYQPVSPGRGRGMTIAEAKAGLSKTFEVPEDAIEITIRA